MKHWLKISFAAALSLSLVQLSNDSVAGEGDKMGMDQIKMSEARHLQVNNDPRQAIEKYKELYADHQGHALLNYRLGECHLTIREYDKALNYFSKAAKLDPEVAFDLDYYHGLALHRNGDLDGALEKFRKFEERLKAATKVESVTQQTKVKMMDVQLQIKKVLFAKESMKNPVDVQIKNLGTKINSEFDEYNPTITADGRTLIFTARREENVGGKLDTHGDNNYFEDVYEASWDSLANDWAEARPAKGKINTETHEANTSISPDGEIMYIYLNEGSQGQSGEIYYSKKSSSGKWGAPRPLGKPINTSFWESSACVTADGSKMYFVAERKDGLGHADIYVSEKEGKSGWSEPVSLGADINTKGDERMVFIHPEGNVLFFSSDGHEDCIGGYDLYKSVLVDGKWSKPVNLGYPINTVDDDGNFIVTADKKKAYYTSAKKGGHGGRDIYEIDLSKIDILK